MEGLGLWSGQEAVCLAPLVSLQTVTAGQRRMGGKAVQGVHEVTVAHKEGGVVVQLCSMLVKVSCWSGGMAMGDTAQLGNDVALLTTTRSPGGCFTTPRGALHAHHTHTPSQVPTALLTPTATPAATHPTQPMPEPCPLCSCTCLCPQMNVSTATQTPRTHTPPPSPTHATC